MKKLFKLLMILSVSMIMLASCSKVQQGEVGIKVKLLGSDKGVNNEVLGVGRYYIGWNEELHVFPTYQQNYTFTRDETEGSPTNEEFVFQTSEGMECSADLGLAMHFDKEKIAIMFQTYRKGVDEIRGITVRNAIRNNLNKITSTMPVEYVYGAGKAKMIDSLQLMTKNQLSPYGIIIDNVFLIGSIRMPESIIKSLNSKVEQTQKAQEAENQLRTAEAQAKIKVVNAQAQADANKLLEASITPTLVQWQAINKWNGILPTVTSGTVPFINVK